MKENTIKAVVSGALAALTAYFGLLVVPLIILFFAVMTDYITGLLKAYMTAQLNSKTGFRGIIKKLSYFVVVIVGGGADWLIEYALARTGIEYNGVFAVAIIVIIWLIINELISILENLAVIGTPIPKFLLKLISKLKNSVEEKVESEEK